MNTSIPITTTTISTTITTTTITTATTISARNYIDSVVHYSHLSTTNATMIKMDTLGSTYHYHYHYFYHFIVGSRKRVIHPRDQTILNENFICSNVCST